MELVDSESSDQRYFNQHRNIGITATRRRAAEIPSDPLNDVPTLYSKSIFHHRVDLLHADGHNFADLYQIWTGVVYSESSGCIDLNKYQHIADIMTGGQ